jgi:hypothetical protein
MRRTRRAFALLLTCVLASPVFAPSPAAADTTVIRPPYTLRAFRWEGQQVRVISFVGQPGVSVEMRLAGSTFGTRRTTSQIGTSSRAVAAINGGFTVAGTGAPRHITVVRGEIITSGVLHTQPGTALLMSADRTRAWIERPTFQVRASAGLARFTITSWNARQPSASRVVAFTARGGNRIYPSLDSCWVLLKPVRGARSLHRTYVVEAVRKSPSCDRRPIMPPTARYAKVVLGGGPNTPIKRLAVGETIKMDIDLGRDGITDVFGGIPALADDGVNVGPACFSTCGPDHGPDRPFYARNPRTAVGITIGCSDEDPMTPCRYLLVTVDGRQPEWSTGLRFPDLGRLMLQLGAWNALNLDGGGSTTMWVRDRNKACQIKTEVGCLVNRPPYGERSVIDAVVLRLR